MEPKGSGHIKKPEHKSTVQTKLSPLLVEVFIKPELRVNETISDCIMRLLTERGRKIGELNRSLSALQERHTKVLSWYEERPGCESTSINEEVR